MMLRILLVCICWASLHGNEGLVLKVSDQSRYHPMGSNVTISCTDESSEVLDWLKGGSHLSACSLTKGCLPDQLNGQKYTVDRENRRFNLKLYNLALSDCGNYTCVTHTDRKSYSLELLDYLKNVDKHMSDVNLSVTTNCVIPTFTVEIQWYYIYKDGPPRTYEKPAKRIEEKGCHGTCEGNNVMKISSLLTPSVGGDNVIPVRFMAYVRQGDHVQQVKFSKESLIEGCAGSPIWHIVLFILVPAMLGIPCNIGLAILHWRDSKTLKDIVSNLVATWICLVMLIGFGIQLAIEEEPTFPDVFGNCHGNYSPERIAAEVCCLLTMVGLIAVTIYHCSIQLQRINQQQRRKSYDLTERSDTEETNKPLTHGLNDDAKIELQLLEEKEKEKGNELKVEEGTPVRLDCSSTQDCFPSWECIESGKGRSNRSEKDRN